MNRDRLVTRLAVDRRRNVVILEIVCRDDYTAVVLQDDITDLIDKNGGLSLILQPNEAR